MIIDVIKKWLSERGLKPRWVDSHGNECWTIGDIGFWLHDDRAWSWFLSTNSSGPIFYYGDPDLFVKLEGLLK